MNPTVYLDNAATTPLEPRVLDAMLPFLKGVRGNPSSLHGPGGAAREAIEEARERVARLTGASPEEVVFTSGGTEADNLALFGLARAAPEGKRHLVVSRIEHAAVREAARRLEREGFEVAWLGVDPDGVVDPAELEASLREDTAFASVMWANNEVGSVQPVEELARLCVGRGVPFHTDAVQAAGREELDVSEVSVSTLAISAHKFYGPQGAGALFVRDGVELDPLVYGGGQEGGLRSGTEDVAGIVGLGVAALLAKEEFSERVEKERALREGIISGLASVPGVHLNGHRNHRLSGNVHVSVDGAEAESLVLMLDARGIAIGKGAACSSSGHKASPALKAMGKNDDAAFSAIRISVGKDNTADDVDAFLAAFTRTVEQLRAMSPV